MVHFPTSKWTTHNLFVEYRGAFSFSYSNDRDAQQSSLRRRSSVFPHYSNKVESCYFVSTISLFLSFFLSSIRSRRGYSLPLDVNQQEKNVEEKKNLEEEITKEKKKKFWRGKSTLQLGRQEFEQENTTYTKKQEGERRRWEGPFLILFFYFYFYLSASFFFFNRISITKKEKGEKKNQKKMFLQVR